MDTSLIVALLGVVVSVISWFAGRSERKVKIRSIELDNVKKVWEIVNYQTSQIEELQKEVISLRNEIVQMCANCNYKKLNPIANWKKGRKQNSRNHQNPLNNE